MVPKLTEAGIAILLKAVSGTAINFTKMQLGNGEPQTEKNAIGLNNPLLTVPFTKIEVSDNHAVLTAAFNNSTVESGFRVTEVGFFVEDPDNEDNEILYALGLEDNSTADFVPDNTNRVLEMEFEALIFIGEAENVTAAINSSLVYASKKEFEEHNGNTSNPHNVTKHQVGLGNVPNVGTNDQAPTYEESATLEPLASGEKLGLAFGKIATLIKKVIAHFGDKKNPHNVTAADTGAAPALHSHSTADINKGTLSIARGGTGATTAAGALENLGAVQVSLGSYIGNGAAATTQQLKFSFTPKLVMISSTSNSSNSILLLRGVSSYKLSNFTINVNWGEKLIAWYGSGDPERMLCIKDETYQYIAIG